MLRNYETEKEIYCFVVFGGETRNSQCCLPTFTERETFR
jgi:hypothetical protein